jgi:VanZ family protein
MTRKQVHLLLLFLIVAFILTMELGFRSYLFKQGGALATIAGSLPNFVAVIFFSVVFVLRKDGEKGSTTFKMVALAVVAMVLYELVQPWLPGRVFDLFDIAASILAGICIYLLLLAVDHLKPRT